MAANKIKDFYPTKETQIRPLLANSLDDCFASGEIATWMAFNFQSIYEQVLVTIHIFYVSWEDGDNIGISQYV